MARTAEDKRQYNREYYARNRERQLEEKRLHYLANRDKYREHCRQYYQLHRNKLRSKAKERRDSNLELHRAIDRKSSLKRHYGITPEDYDRMLATQSGTCAICRTTDPGGKGSFHVDHDHSTGKVRGLLCHHCNVGIGSLGDSVQVLELAINYLKKASRSSE